LFTALTFKQQGNLHVFWVGLLYIWNMLEV
jgi:hypothetical protein